MNPYSILGVTTGATDDEIKQAFRQKARAHHPDKGGSDADMADINKAYAILSDTERRARFDANGDQEDAPSLDDRATGILATVLADALEYSGDLVTLVHTRLQGAIEGAKTEQRQLQRSIDKMAKTRKRVRTKTGTNLVHLLIDQRTDAAQKRIIFLAKAIEEYTCASAMLKDYESTPEDSVEDAFTKAFLKFQTESTIGTDGAGWRA
jgi:curved DNA-binding protein CbpA